MNMYANRTTVSESYGKAELTPRSGAIESQVNQIAQCITELYDLDQRIEAQFSRILNPRPQEVASGEVGQPTSPTLEGQLQMNVTMLSRLVGHYADHLKRLESI
jgi:hypothetical protein